MREVSDIRRKTRVTSALTWLVIPFIITYLATPIASESLRISYFSAYIVTLIVFIYFLTRTLIAFRSRNQSIFIDLSFFVIDLFAISFGVFITGGQNSLFFNLYWASILAGALIFGLRGGLTVATVVFICYGSSSYFSSVAFPNQSFDLSQIVMRFYPLILYTLMVAFLAREEEKIVEEKSQAVRDLKDSEQRRKYLTDTLKESTLTERELEVLTLIAEGFNNKEIAQKIYVSEATVKKHVGSILLKLGLQNRIQAAVYAEKEGIRQQIS